MLQEHEIDEERCVTHLNRYVESTDGMVRVTHVCRTIPMPVWEIKTSFRTLRCAASHLVECIGGNFVPVNRLLPGALVVTIDGLARVVSCRDTGEVRPLYDLRVDGPSHSYFTNGISSHNSSGIGGSLLFNMNTQRDYHALYLAPLMEHCKTFAMRLTSMQRGSICPPEAVIRAGRKSNMYFRESLKGGSLKIMHILTDPTKVRGNTAQSVSIDESQSFDADHLPEIEQVQKSFKDTKTTVFAGTSTHKNTCLEGMYQSCSRGVWHVRCSCPQKHHPLNDLEAIPKMMSVSGLCCPQTGRLLNPLIGEFVHESPTLLDMRQASFHIPQVIVPEYASGDAWLAIWRDFTRYTPNKFFQEVMGIAVDSGATEISEDDLKACCDDYTLEGIQQDILTGRKRFNYIFSGVDWGGSDWDRATKTKQSYTVHSMYGLEPDGRMRLIFACRHAGMHHQQVAGAIVAAHNKYRGFAMGTDNGGGAYYNAHMRDCGRLPTNRIVQFQYTDVNVMLDRIPNPYAVVASLHRTDSLSAVFEDVKAKRLIFPRWENARGFALDFLNVQRNITERPNGSTIWRYLKDPRVADDFLHSTNYACMIKRITMQESLIPNAQFVRELCALMGVTAIDVRGSGGSIVTALTGGHGFISG